MTRRLLAVNAVLLLGTLLLAPRSSAEEAARPLRIACNLPLSGDLATYGDAVREGVEFAREQMPSARDSLQFDWQDNRGLPREAATILQRQISGAPDVYVSGVRPQTMAIWEQVGSLGLPHFVWIFDASIASAAGNNFRTYVSFKQEPALVAAYAGTRHAERVAVVYVRLPHTEQAYEGMLVPQLKDIGVERVLVEGYDLTKTDFRDVALKVKAFGPDLLFLSGFQANLTALIPALAALKLIVPGNTITSYDMIDTLPLLPKQSVEGLRVTAPSFMLDPENRRYQAWRSAFIARHGKPPLYTHAYAFDMAAILADSARRLPRQWTREDVLQALRTADGEGVTGRLRFDTGGDMQAPVELGVIEEGRLVRAKQ